MEQAVRSTRSRGRDIFTQPEKPLDRAETELLRVILTNPPDLGEVSASDFTDDRLSRAFDAIAGQLAETAPGTPVDISHVSDPALQRILRGLVMELRPLPEWSDIQRRLKGKRLEAEIDGLEADLQGLESGSETHSESLRRLIALQQEKRSLGES